MDVDPNDEQVATAAQQQPKKLLIVPVDEAHPFDLESYIAGYTGRTAIDRLIHIVRLCPSIAPDVFNLAVQHIHQSRDPSLYQTLITEYEQLAENSKVKDSYHLPNPLEIAQLDTKWVDEVTAKNQSGKVKLEVELKTYTNNMIKESIRMAHRDLAEFYRSIGEYQQSLRHHTKSREFCATSQHVLDMCLSVLELLIEQRNYSHLSTYVFKAEAALDATSAAANNAGPGGAPSSTPTSTIGPSAASGSGSNAKKKSPTDREIVQSRLELASALSHLGQSNYEKAAHSFLKIGPAKELGDWIGKLITQSDIAIYGTLCALASMPRGAIKAQLLDNAVFGVYIEQEPYVRELLEAYINSNFKTTLGLLSKYSTRHYLDIHLSPHVHDLTNMVKNSAVVLYFKPFASIKLDRMSEAFGWSVDTVEHHVVGLIQSGEIQGRVDSQNKILYAKKTDNRADLFSRTIQAGNDILSANRKVLLRMRLQQADLIVKPPKGHSQQYGMAPDYYPE